MGRPLKLNIYQQQEAINLYLTQNLSTFKIAKLLNVSAETIRHTLKIHNVILRKASSTIKLSTKFTFREMNEQKAFILGVIYGDGSISIRQDYINITSADLEILEKIKNILGEKFKIKKIKNCNYYRGVIYSHKLCEELLELFKLTNNKSDKLIFPKLNISFMPAFISGYLATDGCITISHDKRNNNKNLSVNFYSCSGQYLLDLKNFIYSEISAVGNFYERKNIKGHLGKKPLFILTFNGKKAEILMNYICNHTDKNLQCIRKINKFYEYITNKYGLISQS